MAPPKASDVKACIIHKSTSLASEEPLTSPKDYKSWNTLLEAAKIRNHSELLEVSKFSKEDEVPNIYYHQTCRSVFTMPRDLKALKSKYAEGSEDENTSMDSSVKRPTRQPASESRLYVQECLFCGNTKRVKGTSTREKLIKATELRVDDKLRKIAIMKNDDKLIQVTSRDIVAAEAHYHHSCYNSYTRKYSQLLTEGNGDAVTAEYRTIQDEALNDLASFIRIDIFGKNNMYT
jgi:hypothetical protein